MDYITLSATFWLYCNLSINYVTYYTTTSQWRSYLIVFSMNTGGSDLWSNTLPLDQGGARVYTMGSSWWCWYNVQVAGWCKSFMGNVRLQMLILSYKLVIFTWMYIISEKRNRRQQRALYLDKVWCYKSSFP